MRFWDSSAIAPLLLEEEASESMRELLREDRDMVVWWGSRVECTSAVRRREREGSLEAAAAREALELLAELADSWAEVQPTDLVRAGAARALAVHPLHAADALQLSAALSWGGAGAERPELVCLDRRLGDAASREGLQAKPARAG